MHDSAAEAGQGHQVPGEDDTSWQQQPVKKESDNGCHTVGLDPEIIMEGVVSQDKATERVAAESAH